MEHFLEKISSYNIFNYLLPGVLFVAICKHFGLFDLNQEDLLLNLFLYYFMGLIISRFGSLIIEPILKRIGFVKFAPYGDFIKACSIDDKIDTLSEVNNTYRSLLALSICIPIAAGYDKLISKYALLDDLQLYFWSVLLILLFLFSYRKQTSYITSRVKKTLSRI